MKSVIVVGLQWGDEGKGKIIDALAPGFDYVVRSNGGNNAGHTVVVDGIKYPLSLVPSGVLQGKKLLIAQGVVITPNVLLDEIAMLTGRGIVIHLTIDPRCHIVMPYHQLLDAANEQWKGKLATGSLHLGIGYCYEDRNNRHGIRMEDLIRPNVLAEKVRLFFPLKKAMIEKAYGMKTNMNVDEMIKTYSAYGKRLAIYVDDVARLVGKDIDRRAFLFEQAHGTMLDPVFGTYPYTVAPPTIASSVFSSVGIPSRELPVLGVVKAYTTRVGNGPLPTEIQGNIGDQIRAEGAEFGTVSKRPRRVGWLDLPQLKFAVRVNGCTALALTKLDVLDSLSSLDACTYYSYKGTRLREFPSEMNTLPQCKPVYKRLRGWCKDIGNIKTFTALPAEAKSYIQFIESELEVPIRYISYGAERGALLCR